MFERFTDGARQTIVLAQDEARALKHNYLGTEHLLLGMLREDGGVAAQALESLAIDLDRVRAEVARIVGHGDEATPGELPLTPRAKRVLELALRESLTLGHREIATEHILLGLVREGEGVAARILRDFGADAVRVREEVMERRPSESGAAPDDAVPSRPRLRIGAPPPEVVTAAATALGGLAVGVLLGWAIWG